MYFIFFFKQKTAYEMRISDWSSDVCSSDLDRNRRDNRKRSPPYPCLHPYAGSSHQAYALVADVRPPPPPCSGMGAGRRHWICADSRSCDPEATGRRLVKPARAFRWRPVWRESVGEREGRDVRQTGTAYGKVR